MSNNIINLMEKCTGCGESYFAGVIAPGKVCFACTVQKTMQEQEKRQTALNNAPVTRMSDERASEIYQKLLGITCTIDLDHKQVHVYRDSTLIAIVTNMGLVRFLLQYPHDLTLSMNDLAIIEDNFNQMQEMLKEGLTS